MKLPCIIPGCSLIVELRAADVFFHFSLSCAASVTSSQVSPTLFSSAVTDLRQLCTGRPGLLLPGFHSKHLQYDFKSYDADNKNGSLMPAPLAISLAEGSVTPLDNPSSTIDNSNSKLFGSKSTDFETEALGVHNEYRLDHGVPPLVLNKNISKVSQKWADELAKKDAMAYSLNQSYGENVYTGWSSDPNTKVRARDCVDKWYSEINDYVFSEEPKVPFNCGHFTQIVWKSTIELGIGSAKSKSGKLYVVANYYPPGNFSEQFTKNVLPPGAMQFRGNYSPVGPSPKGSNNNIAPAPPTSNRNSKNFGEIASDLVSKFKSTAISGDKFEDEFLQAHNEYRKKHGVPPMELSKKLCRYAEEWAKVLLKKGKMEHRDQNDYGENIFYACSSDPNFVVSGRDAVDKWYDEIKIHKFGKEPTSLGSGHFTQVVWEDSKEVGVGVARSKDGHVYVVANYFPPGNMIGSFARKVPPPII